MRTQPIDQPVVLEAMSALRPRLHRYCARMMGSAADGEDVVQDTLAKATEALSAAGRIERPESWLFRIAQTTALDALRKRRRGVLVEVDLDGVDVVDPGAQADARVAAESGLAAFLVLPPVQRSSVLMVDVLGYSLAETAALLELTLATVKAALNRARGNLQRLAREPDDAAPTFDLAERARLRTYADRFNARDFDALRALLAEDVRLDLPNRIRPAGKTEVAVYFSRYEATPTRWRLKVGVADGRLALLASDPADLARSVRFVVFLDWRNGKIVAIHDFLSAPYAIAAMNAHPDQGPA